MRFCSTSNVEQTASAVFNLPNNYLTNFLISKVSLSLLPLENALYKLTLLHPHSPQTLISSQVSCWLPKPWKVLNTQLSVNFCPLSSLGLRDTYPFFLLQVTPIPKMQSTTSPHQHSSSGESRFKRSLPSLGHKQNWRYLFGVRRGKTDGLISYPKYDSWENPFLYLFKESRYNEGRHKQNN